MSDAPSRGTTSPNGRDNSSVTYSSDIILASIKLIRSEAEVHLLNQVNSEEWQLRNKLRNKTKLMAKAAFNGYGRLWKALFNT